MEKIINYLKSNQAKAIYWQSANLLVLLLVGLVTETGFYPTLFIPLLNWATKEINKKYL